MKRLTTDEERIRLYDCLFLGLAMDKLPSKSRLIPKMHYFHGPSFETIASI